MITTSQQLDRPTHELIASMEAAARCATLLEQLGLQITFQRAAAFRGVEITLRHASGERVRELSPGELFELLTLTPDRVAEWAASSAGGLQTTCCTR